jgi:hypothetical protein
MPNVSLPRSRRARDSSDMVRGLYRAGLSHDSGTMPSATSYRPLFHTTGGDVNGM